MDAERVQRHYTFLKPLPEPALGFSYWPSEEIVAKHARSIVSQLLVG